MWIYRFLDFICTVAQAFAICPFIACFCREKRFHPLLGKELIGAGLCVSVFAATWFGEIGALKIPIIWLLTVILIKVFYKATTSVAIMVCELWYALTIALPEQVVITLFRWSSGNNITVQVGDEFVLRWQMYLCSFFLIILASYCSYRLLKDFLYCIQPQDCVVLTIIFIIIFVIHFAGSYGFLEYQTTEGYSVYVIGALLCIAFMIQFLYSKNLLYLREKERQDVLTIERMNQQFAYYQSKLKDEERVRSVYHDMKNHLLVLERQMKSPETAKMVEELQQQMTEYEDYVHTGNIFLDIILKEKLESAKEKHINFSVTADLSGIDLIEPLDISTIFGNGLDNAMEASEKLPKGQRVVLVKAGRMQDFLSVRIENNCTKESKSIKSNTTKKDSFLHGFGISNMKNAAEKYGGQLSTSCENGKFTLKILIPI